MRNPSRSRRRRAKTVSSTAAATASYTKAGPGRYHWRGKPISGAAFRHHDRLSRPHPLAVPVKNGQK